MLNITGIGTASLYKTDHTGVIEDIVPREGTYSYIDDNTGEEIVRPNSWTAMFADGSRMSWPTYYDEDGEVKPWNRFDPKIDLAYCAANGIALHMWKDDKGYTRLELAE